MHLRGTTHVRKAVISAFRSYSCCRDAAARICLVSKSRFRQNAPVLKFILVPLVSCSQPVTRLSVTVCKKTTYAPSLQDLFIIWSPEKVKRGKGNALRTYSYFPPHSVQNLPPVLGAPQYLQTLGV